MEKVTLPKVETQESFIEIEGTVRQVLKSDEDGMEKGFCYIKGDYVYIYAGKVKKNKARLPGHVYKDGKEYIWIDPIKDEEKEMYSVDRIKVFSSEDIINAVNEGNDFKEVDISIIENSDKYFAPAITDDDDIFKRIVKTALAKKKITLKAYRDKFKNDYDISNMRYALTKNNPMSTKYLQKWVEILDLRVEINVTMLDGENNKVSFTEVFR